MVEEHGRIVLTEDLPQENLRASDVGTVVFVHAHGVAYEVEFLTLAGVTVAAATVEAGQLRPVSQADITHARSLVGFALRLVMQLPGKQQPALRTKGGLFTSCHEPLFGTG